MKQIGLAEAKARLSELVDAATKGEIVEITRRGKAAVRLTSPGNSKLPIDAAALKALTDQMPLQLEDGETLVRRMRDDNRYWASTSTHPYLSRH